MPKYQIKMASLEPPIYFDMIIARQELFLLPHPLAFLVHADACF